MRATVHSIYQVRTLVCHKRFVIFKGNITVSQYDKQQINWFLSHKTKQLKNIHFCYCHPLGICSICDMLFFSITTLGQHLGGNIEVNSMKELTLLEDLYFRLVISLSVIFSLPQSGWKSEL